MLKQTDVQIADIQNQFPQMFSEIIGKRDATVSGVFPPEQAEKGAMVFISDAKFLERALSSDAAAIVLSPKSKDQILALSSDKLEKTAFLFSKNVKLSMALIKNQYFSNEVNIQKAGTIHATAVVDPTAKIGKGTSIGPYSIIGQNVIIGENVIIDALVTIEADCTIQSGSHLYSQLYIGPRTEVGKKCVLQAQSTIGSEGFGFAHDEKGHFHRIPHTGKVVLEDNVEIGSHCTIDRGTFGVTKIGEGSKIDKQCHIAHNCEIGKHTAIAASFAVAGSTKIGNHCVFGGRVTMRDGLTICDQVELAAASGVHNNITTPGKYGGHPLLPIRDSMRTITSMAHLPKMRKQLLKVLKHLGLEEAEEQES